MLPRPAATVRWNHWCGENWWGAQDLQHAVDAQASDYVTPDVMGRGGGRGEGAALEEEPHVLEDGPG